MDNPDDDRIIINVKGVRKSAWNAATRAASLSKEPYGQWLSDAIDLRLRIEAEGVKLPGEAGEAPLTADQTTARLAALAEAAKGFAALKTAGGRSVGISALSRRLAALLSEIPTANPPLRIARIGQESVKREPILLESDPQA